MADTKETTIKVECSICRTTVPHSDVGFLIGRGGMGVKKCISNAWRLYEKFQSSDKKVDEDKPTLRIVFQPQRQTDEPQFPEVWVEVYSESKTMRGLASLTVKKNVETYVQKKDTSSYSFVIEYPHNLIGHFIGKGWKNAKNIASSVIYEDGGICEEDVATANTARLNVSPNPHRPNPQFDNIKTTKGIIDFVQNRSETCFTGWPPEENDEFEQYIMVTVSFNRNAEPFNDRVTYINKLKDSIMDSVKEIKEKNDDEMDEITEYLGL